MSKEHVTIHLTDWCPFCKKLVSDLKKQNIEFTAINVDDNPEAGEWVKSVNDGNRIVPTVLYSDGTYATNPPAHAVAEKLASLQ